MLASRPLLSFIVSSSCLLAQASWSQLYPVAAPTPRNDALMGHHEASASTVLLFGASQSGALAQCWKLLPSTWALVPGSLPPHRGASALAYDSVRQRIVLFGGNNLGTLLADTWEWDGVVWQQRLPVASPPPRCNHAMAFDRVRGVVVLFGGLDGGAGNTSLRDTWEWNGTSWSQRFPSNRPASRNRVLAAFDPVRRQVLLHGGSNDATYPPIVFNDTWLFDGTNWTQQQPSTPPTFRFDATLVSDWHRGRVVLLGGTGLDPSTWEWDGHQWTSLTLVGPGIRQLAGAVYDAQARRVVLHGGSVPVSGMWVPVNDTWSYSTPQPADVVPFGGGCAGSAGTPSLANAPYVLPWLGDTMRDIVGNVPAASLGAIFVSSFGTTPPVSLAFLGMPGCTALVPLDTAEFRTANAGQAEWSLPLPNSIALAGAQFRQQAYVLDAAANAFGITASNAVTVTLGVR